MSWLNNIFESIINEIGANDAYMRFYTSIPREDYDRILDGDPAPDRFMQFILNCVRDQKNSVDTAVEAVKRYKHAPSEIRQRIQESVKSGEFDSIDDMISSIEYFTNGGKIVSRKQFAKSGFITLKETSEAIVTCTTNYTANNHFFGKTHWCTASDRSGDYDGYHMFLRYASDRNAILFQFKPRKKVLQPLKDRDGVVDEQEDYPTPKEEENNAVRYQFQLIQLQLTKAGDDYQIGQICDFLDKFMSEETLRAVVGEEAFNVVKDEDLFAHLLSIQNEQYAVEHDYQESKDAAIKAKKERRQRELQLRRETANQEVKRMRGQEELESLNIWDKFLSEKMFTNGELLQKIYNRSVEDEEIPAEECYCAGIQSWNNYNGTDDCISVLGLSPITRKWYFVDEIENENGEVIDFIPQESEYSTTIDKQKWLWLIIKSNNDLSNITVLDYDISDMDGRYLSSRTIYPDYGDKVYFAIEGFRGTNSIFDADNLKTYDASCIKEFDYLSNCVNIGDEYTIFSNNYNNECGVLVKGSDKIELANTKDSIYYYNNTYDSLCIRGAGGKSRLMSIDPENHGSLMCDVTLNLQEIAQTVNGGVRFNFNKDKLFIHSFTPSDIASNILRIRCRDGNDGNVYYQLCNAIDINNPSEAIFGKWSLEWIRETNGDLLKATIESIGGRYENYYLYYSPREKKYYKAKCLLHGDETRPEPCDRYGRTEKDMVAQKNFKDWKQKGGHSPEAQAQMDKMWNDQHDGDFGTAAMKDWNDDDRGLDSKYFQYGDNDFNRALQHFDKDDRWRGAVDLKDPVGYSNEMMDAIKNCDGDSGKIQKLVGGDVPASVRRNPWFRVDKHGKAIDQPWYDEDEIPANLSDRVDLSNRFLREEKINEQYNNLQSLMRRMGLLD